MSMFFAAFVVEAVLRAEREKEQFEASIAYLSPEDQKAACEARQARKKQEAEDAKCERERKEYLDAITPKTFWWYLGLSSK